MSEVSLKVITCTLKVVTGIHIIYIQYIHVQMVMQEHLSVCVTVCVLLF